MTLSGKFAGLPGSGYSMDVDYERITG